MPSFTDQTGNTITLSSAPTRIVSLVPSQTELLFDLGLDEQVAGITKFCVHPPEWHHTKTRVGGTKKLHLDTIYQLQPDLIIANKEENTKEEIEALAGSYPVWVSDISNLAHACEMIRQVGEMTGTTTKASGIISSIQHEFDQLRQTNPPFKTMRAAYLVWNDPFMTVGSDTFIHAMLSESGLENVFAGKSRYPVISQEDIRNSGCEVLLLSSEPYPFKQKHIDQLQPLFPGIKILIADGEMFSWYGSRLQYAPRYFARLHSLLRN